MRLLVLLTAISLLGLLESSPLYKETLNIRFAPESTSVINEAETQIFRAPICGGVDVDTWVFTVKTYLINVPWDPSTVEDNWLRIRVSNSSDMRWTIADNADDTHGPGPVLGPFKYQASTWGAEDVYIAITASSGCPTYQYGLEVVGAEATSEHGNRGVPDVAPKAKVGGPIAVDSTIVTLKQMAVPHRAVLSSGRTAQFKVPFCFEPRYHRRSVTGTVTVISNNSTVAAGGAATFFCTTGMMRHDECFRSIVMQRGSDYYDTSGDMINTVTPVIVKEEFGPVHLLVLAVGDYGKDVTFIITTKLHHPDRTTLLSDTGDHEQDMASVLVHPEDSCVLKCVALNPDDELGETKDEL